MISDERLKLIRRDSDQSSDLFLKLATEREINEMASELLERRQAQQSISERMMAQKEWLYSNRPEIFVDQKHLEEGSNERTYWHYGYMVALSDVSNYGRRSQR